MVPSYSYLIPLAALCTSPKAGGSPKGQSQPRFNTGAPRGSYMDRVRRQRAQQGMPGYEQYMQNPPPKPAGPPQPPKGGGHPKGGTGQQPGK